MGPAYSWKQTKRLDLKSECKHIPTTLNNYRDNSMAKAYTMTQIWSEKVKR